MMAAVTLSRLITLREAADLMKETGPDRVRRVRRRLLGLPNASDIVVTIGGVRRRQYRVSLSALRLHIPQLRDPENDVIPVVREEVQRAVSELDDQITEVREDFDALGTEVGRRYRDLLERVKRLEAWHAASVTGGGR